MRMRFMCQTGTMFLRKSNNVGSRRKYRVGSLSVVFKAGCGPYWWAGHKRQHGEALSLFLVQVAVIGDMFDYPLLSHRDFKVSWV